MNDIYVSVLQRTPDMIPLIYSAYRQCYSSTSAVVLNVEAKNGDYNFLAEFIKNCMKRGHLSPLEHASFTFSLVGCSRVCTHQLVRHRLASYSQQSQRYVRVKKTSDVPCVIPDSIHTLCLTRYTDMLQQIYSFYDYMLSKGVPQEDARYILPEASRTNIVVTMNLRELLHFFHERLCGKAQDEIREVAGRMAGLVIKTEPWLKDFIGPKCKGKERCMDGDIVLCSEHYRWRFEDEEAIDVNFTEEKKEDNEENPSD